MWTLCGTDCEYSKDRIVFQRTQEKNVNRCDRRTEVEYNIRDAIVSMAQSRD